MGGVPGSPCARPARTYVRIDVFSELLAETAKGRLGGEGDQMLSEIVAGASGDEDSPGGPVRLLAGELRESADPSTSITSLNRVQHRCRGG